MKKSFFSFSFFLACLAVQAQEPSVEALASGVATSLRGLSVVNDNVVWVSGSNGVVGRSVNGGKNWKWMTVAGFEKKDFRDIEAFDASTAIIMSIDAPAYILKTIDGGESWKVVYENNTQGMFLDAMEFWNEQAGIVIGDPIDGRFFIARTFDGGSTWKEIPLNKRPVADSGEACFAASGTNIRALNRGEAVFVTGGLKSRLFKRDKAIDLPFTKGSASTGANSVSVWDYFKRKGGKRIIVAGGDYKADSLNELNCFITHNGGKTWFSPKIPPHGYRSSIEYVSKTDIFACGLNGVDYSSNGGKEFQWISKESFHVCRIARQGKTIYLAGAGGKVGKITWK